MNTTKKNVLSLLVWVLAASITSAIAAASSPPASVDIYQNLERLWSRRKYAELDQYVGELRQEWRNYAPVELTLAIYSYRFGAQIEDSIEILTKLRNQVGADIETASPLFLTLLDGRIYRYQRSLNFEMEHGISREQRLSERHPLKKTTFTFSQHWVGVDDMLYFNVPEVFLSDQGGIPARDETDGAPDAELQRLDYRQLLDLVDATGTAMSMRKAAVEELVRRRVAEGNPGTVAQGLFEGRTVYTGHETADALVKMGASAIPAILEKITDPMIISRNDKTRAIWVLIRIGILNLEVTETLQNISTNTIRPAYAEYARAALQRLQEKNVENPHSGDAAQALGLNHGDPGISAGLADESVNRTATAYDDPGRHNRGRLFRKASAADAKKERLKSAMPTVAAVAILAVAAALALFLWHRKTKQRSQ